MMKKGFLEIKKLKKRSEILKIKQYHSYMYIIGFNY